MKYIINDVVVDSNERTVSRQTHVQKVRPRTLAVLILFIESPQKVLSKQHIMDVVWADVVVDDAVVAQSISEIRKLFCDKNIIVSHPKQGYAFVADVQREPLSQARPKPQKQSRRWAMGAVALSLVFCVFLFVFGVNPLSPTPNKVLVLPMKHALKPTKALHWLEFGGMASLINELQQHTDNIYVYGVEDIVQALGTTRNLVLDRQDYLHHLFEVSGATHIVELQFLGQPQDVKVAINIVTSQRADKHVLFSHSVDEGVTTASDFLLSYFDASTTNAGGDVDGEFKSNLFAEAILAHEKDWDSAISFFESYLNVDTDSTKALRYLIKLYIWKGQYDKAATKITQLQAIQHKSEEDAIYLSYYQGLLAQKMNDNTAAITWFDLAFEKAKHRPLMVVNARLFLSYGDSYFAEQDFVAALKYYRQALRYHDDVGNAMGVSSMKLHIAKTLIKLERHEEAAVLYNEATALITALNLYFLRSMASDIATQLYPSVSE